MRVLLINPPYDIARYMGKLSKIGFVFPPIGLTYIASYLRKKGTEVSLFDFQVRDDDIDEHVRDFDPEIIGITCTTALVYSTIELSKILKRRFPGKVIIVGGVHPSIRPEDLLSEGAVDYVARGEGEITMEEFIEAVGHGRDPRDIPGICCIRDGEMVCAPPRDMVKDLDFFPMPAVDLLPLHKYRTSPDNLTGERVGVLLTARGCPFDCIFCSSRLLTHGRYRMHSIDRVCAEVERYIGDYNVNQLFILDDNFAVNKKRSKELCREFIRRGFHKKITWWADARVDCVDEELLMLMAEAGCTILSYGLESGVQRILDFANKGITLEQVRETVGITKKAGIDVRATFILGLPTETKEESLQTIRFAKELPLDQVRFSLATPFPGTKLYEIALEEGGFTSNDWTSFSMMSGYASGTPVYVPKNRDAKELGRLQRKANMMFFLRPRILKTYLKRIKSFYELRRIAAGFARFVWATFFPGR